MIKKFIRILVTIWVPLTFGSVIAGSVVAGPTLADTCPTDADCKTVEVLRITPKGKNVTPGQQITIHFDRPAVSLGDMSVEQVPVQITPSLNCHWRWISTRALACQLDGEHQLQLASHYKVSVNAGLIPNTESVIGSSFSSDFYTKRPQVTYHQFETWRGPAEPVFRVSFNQKVKKESVVLAIRLKSRGKVYPVQVDGYSYDKTDPASISENDVWLVSPAEPLPEDEAAQLEVQQGLESTEGLLKGYERRRLRNFHTFPEFNLVGVRCRLEGDDSYSEVTMATLKSDTVRGCLPRGGISLLFSSPVLNSQVREEVTFSPALNKGLKDYDPWANRGDWSQLYRGYSPEQRYSVWLPEKLRAAETYQVDINIENFHDEFGRHLKPGLGGSSAGQLNFEFDTSHREPSLRLAHQVAVLESGVESDVPLYVTNLDQIEIDYQSLNQQGGQSNQSRQLEVGKVQDVSHKVPLNTRALLNDQSGIFYGTLVPKPGNIKRDSSKLLAQVTPFQVHTKVGHFNTLVWVTRLDNGKPVKRATVTLHLGNYESISNLENTGFGAKTNRKGLATLPGTSEYDPGLFHQYSDQMFFIKVEHKNEFAILPLNYDFRVWGNIYASQSMAFEHSFAWGTSAQGVYKTGGSVQFKIYVRDQSNKHWLAPEAADYVLSVIDPHGNTVYEQDDIRLNEFGAFSGEFTLNKNAAVGHYEFELARLGDPADEKGEEEDDEEVVMNFSPLSILVSDFTVAPFKVDVNLNGERFEPGDSLSIEASASMYAGGPYAAGELRLNLVLQERIFSSDSPHAVGFSFGHYYDEEHGEGNGGEYGHPNGGLRKTLLNIKASLDSAGEHTESLKLDETEIYFGTIRVEAAVKDERGKNVASRAAAQYTGRTRFVGLKNSQWIYQSGEAALIDMIVTNASGEPVASETVNISVQRLEIKSARVKSAGNAYITENTSEWIEHAECVLKSKLTAVPCQFVPEVAGQYRLIASVKDTHGRLHQSRLGTWVTGMEYVRWFEDNNNRLDIIPEKNTYQIGETARYLIQNPIPDASALVTVERYGVIDSWTQTLNGSAPVIEVKIREDYLPGFYLSVVLQSPRVEQPLGEGKVDLGKPTFQMGYVETGVEDDRKRIFLEVETDKSVYRPGDKVEAKIRLPGSNKRRKVEFAVAVVDESVLALNGEGAGYYDPYKGFNVLDPLDVVNYSLLSRLVGRQKFEKKGANPGGGGGGEDGDLRDNFKYVSYWNPSVIADRSGKANIIFDVPDNLTAWRVIVLAVSPDDKMGIGHSTFKVNRPTEVWPVMPNQVMTGDSFQAGFSVTNRTDRDRKIAVEVNLKKPDGSTKSHNFLLRMKPFERRKQFFPVKVFNPGAMKFTISAGDKTDRDLLAYTLNVKEYDFTLTSSDFGLVEDQLGGPTQSISLPIRFPTDAVSASLSAKLSVTVMGDLSGAFDYLQTYPYACFEQQLSRAVGASVYQSLNTYLPENNSWPESQAVIDSPIDNMAAFQAPNGGMAFWRASNNYVSPYLSVYAALVFNWLDADGLDGSEGETLANTIDKINRDKLYSYLSELLKRNHFPNHWSDAVGTQLRAGILAALAPTKKISTADLNRFRHQMNRMDIFAKAMYLQATVEVLGAEANLAGELVDQILNSSNETTSKLLFSESNIARSPYLLSSNTRASCAVLSSFVDYALAPTNGDKPDNRKTSVIRLLPKLVRGINGAREGRLSWKNTQENAYCLHALDQYAAGFEGAGVAAGVGASVAATYQGESLGEALLSIPKNPTVDYQMDITQSKSAVTLTKQGDGPVYYSTTLSYKPTQQTIKKINAGFDIRKEYSIERDGQWQIIAAEDQSLKTGDLIKVDLFLNVPTARYYVVVDDPIPGGLEAVNTQLATNSELDAAASKMAVESYWFKVKHWVEMGDYGSDFYHQELRFDSARFYADALQPGNYHLSYTTQVIAAGNFASLPVRVEEMYEPEVYGNGAATRLEVAN